MGGGRLTPPPTGRFTTGRETRYPFYMRLSGPQDRSERVRKISPPPPLNFVFYSLVLCTSAYLVVLLSCIFLCAFTTHNTNIHAPIGIKTRNPSRRSAADPHLRPLGHTGSAGIRSQNRPAHSESLYRLHYAGPPSTAYFW